MIDWPLAFSSASQAIKLVNELRSIDKEMSQAELKLKIADLSSALADLKMTLTEAKSEASEKDDEINRLKKLQQRLSFMVIPQGGWQIYRNTSGSSTKQPYGRAGGGDQKGEEDT